ncbi:MBL fold hydrolase [Tersicoccus solisilvae]|uniref:MBL fold hydrolase n=1 Tax=Tersicoccus solisilvae TaxID=1882339 RepID=A0ABQ1PI17_9MICC|nr:MBL fold metallo-hydrolase [Tersicoccus solisilvae]GGC97222.1 MBL fold hydrolase [Tersicoccus solisilvae]
MTSTGAVLLDTSVDGLKVTPSARLPYQADVVVRSFVLDRPHGTVIVYNSPGITAAATAIEALRPTRLLINHAHEAMYGPPGLDVPVLVHERDRAETARALPVAQIVDGRQWIDDDLEAIPTPGHTAGTTCYRWTHDGRRVLFTGDAVWIEHGAWKAVVLDPGLRDDYVASLELIRGLDVDVLVPWGTTDDGPPLALTDRADFRSRIDAIIGRVRAGGTR